MTSETSLVKQSIVRRSQRISTRISTSAGNKLSHSVLETSSWTARTRRSTKAHEDITQRAVVLQSDASLLGKAQEDHLETTVAESIILPKTTTFKGRLGYACLNTLMRGLKPDPVFCSRTCRIDTILKKGLDYVKSLALQNVCDLLKIIEWNEIHNIRFMRISSDLFPFASHGEYGYDISFAKEELQAVGALAKKYNHRLTSHPGQFTQLASPKNNVVTASIRELEYHTKFMDLMGLDKDGVIIVHMGGTYGDKEAALARFKENYQEKLNSNIKARLVLENDEFCYNIEELLPISQELNIPIVIDYHHDWLYPSSRSIAKLIPIVNDVWMRKGIRPKQHLSSPRPGAITIVEKRGHAKRCYTLPEELPNDMDLMIEAKDKEQAVFELYRIYGLHPVDEASWRPELIVDVEELADDVIPSTSRKRRKTNLKE
ncbi:hypothetical protein Clacol_002020 [Clathrus columnatus]|uniref:UV-endonuclease UvdE n=1 Tax=Clathrus columnatus TaxID=1419009 RepID=A0AAV5A0N5_9AGAM|nr:hypothetical protein Clacol_002020 [Clathrus columnatus]